MLLGIVSDTHGHVPYAMEAVRMLHSLQVEQVIHCGDVCSGEIVELFTHWPTHFVLGNCDQGLEREIERAALRCKLHYHGAFGQLELAGRKIAFLHSDDMARFRHETTRDYWDMVCYGHTHIAKQEQIGKTLVLNPGALYRATPHSIAVVDLTTMQATHVPL